MISIHAPHARSDFDAYADYQSKKISIHAPHARSDVVFVGQRLKLVISIHAPHARSDHPYHPFCMVTYHFNPRSSCEERLHESRIILVGFGFQSTLLMRGATQDIRFNFNRHVFQSTLLMRGATRCHWHSTGHWNFNPRSSCEERRGVAL